MVLGDRVYLIGGKYPDSLSHPYFEGKFGRIMGTIVNFIDNLIVVSWDTGRITKVHIQNLMLVRDMLDLPFRVTKAHSHAPLMRGDYVLYVSGNHGIDSKNPLYSGKNAVIGRVTGLSKGTHLPVKVNWVNGTSNVYKRLDLITIPVDAVHMLQDKSTVTEDLSTISAIKGLFNVC